MAVCFCNSWDVVDDIGCGRASRFFMFLFLRKGRQRPIFRQQNETNYFADTKTAFLIWIWILQG